MSAAFAPRPAEAADLDGIMAVERASFPDDAWSSATMAADLASPHTRYLVLEEAGRIVGYAGLRAPAGGRDADIQTIAISAESRARGRGRTLLTALLAEAHARGVREVFLDVREDNPVARALYASEGFAEIGRRPRYYQPADVDAVVMRLDLPGWSAARPAASRPEDAPRAEDATRAEEMRRAEDSGALASPPSAASPSLHTGIGAGSGLAGAGMAARTESSAGASADTDMAAGTMPGVGAAPDAGRASGAGAAWARDAGACT